MEKPYHHGNLRQALIETGLEVIAEQGVRALTLREIGLRLHVSRMAPYRHFSDKAALLGAIAAAGFLKFTEALEQAVEVTHGGFEARMKALAVAYVRFALENRAHFEVMFGGGGEPQYLNEAGQQVAMRSFLVLENMVRTGQQQGLIISGNPTAIAQMVWATVHGISTLRLGVEPGKKKWRSEFTDFCSDLLRTGLKPREGR